MKKYSFLKNKIIEHKDANISISSSSSLYGLSLYTVISVKYNNKKNIFFRIDSHWERLKENTKKIGWGNIEDIIKFEYFEKNLKKLIKKNNIKEDVFFRVTIHAVSEMAGVRMSGLEKVMSIFVYSSSPILNLKGSSLKTSKWVRLSEKSIPPNLKATGSYINSSLAKQEALDNGFEDCLFLNKDKFISEISIANIFFVKKNKIYTPSLTSDILDGITRNTLIKILLEEEKIKVLEKKITLKEILQADEVFVCGTSVSICPIIKINSKKFLVGDITKKLSKSLSELQETENNWTKIL